VPSSRYAARLAAPSSMRTVADLLLFFLCHCQWFPALCCTAISAIGSLPISRVTTCRGVGTTFLSRWRFAPCRREKITHVCWYSRRTRRVTRLTPGRLAPARGTRTTDACWCPLSGSANEAEGP